MTFLKQNKKLTALKKFDLSKDLKNVARLFV